MSQRRTNSAFCSTRVDNINCTGLSYSIGQLGGCGLKEALLSVILQSKKKKDFGIPSEQPAQDLGSKVITLPSDVFFPCQWLL
jgi:hypothetical protein